MLFYRDYFGVFIEQCISSFVLIGCCVTMLIYVPIVMYGLKLFIVYRNFNTTLYNGRHGVLSVCKVSFLNSVHFFEVCWLKLKKKNTTKNCENEHNFNNFPAGQFVHF